MVGESLVNRQNLNPLFDSFGVFPDILVSTPSALASVLKPKYMYVGTRSTDISVSSAQLRVVVGSAGTTLKAVILRLDSTNALIVVPGTAVTFDTSGTAVIVSKTLTQEVTLSAGVHYWLGAVASSGTPTFGAFPTSTTRQAVSYISTHISAVTDFPVRTSAQELVKYNTGNMPMVHYLSKSAAEFL